MDAPTPPPDARQIAHGLVRIAMALRHEGYRGRERHGLSVTQSQIAAVLRSRGPMRVGDLARELGITSPTASDSVGALERKGLVQRADALGDARAKRVTLTTQGESLLQNDRDMPLVDVVARLSEGHREGLLAGLVDLIGELANDGTIAPPRMCSGCAWFRPNETPDTVTPHRCAFIDAPLAVRDLRVDCGDFRASATSPRA